MSIGGLGRYKIEKNCTPGMIFFKNEEEPKMFTFQDLRTRIMYVWAYLYVRIAHVVGRTSNLA